MHALAAVHDTPSRALPVAPVGLGVLWSLHELPSHTSANVNGTPELLR